MEGGPGCSASLREALQDLPPRRDHQTFVDLVVADQDCPALDRAAAAGVTTQTVPLEGDRAEWNERMRDTVAAAAPAAIGAVSENDKSFGKALIFVALGEGIALYGMLVAILIWTKV